VVAVTVDPRGRNELGDGLKELEGRKQQLGAAVDVRLGESVDQVASLATFSARVSSSRITGIRGSVKP